MSDLIKRLRDDKKHRYGQTHSIRHEAADEIERLTEYAKVSDSESVLAEERIATLEAALTSIVGQTDDQFVDGVCREVNTTAREALKEAK